MKEKKISTEFLDRFGLNSNEIKELNELQLINYIKYHHKKNERPSSILFIDFPDEESQMLTKAAENYGLQIKTRITPNLTFICAKDETNSKRIETATKNGAYYISPSDLKLIFKQEKYDLNECNLIFDQRIDQHYRIPKPLSNFNATKEIESFSFDNDKIYTVNLYNFTCSCPDFKKMSRDKHPRGDIRRLCKHLMREYRVDFGTDGLTQIQKCIFENERPVYNKFKDINLRDFSRKIIVNFDNNQSWSRIYVEQENSSFKDYSYDFIEKRFSYGETPRGITAPLRVKLDELGRQLIITSKKSMIEQTNSKKQSKAGCASVVILFSILFLYGIFVLLDFSL